MTNFKLSPEALRSNRFNLLSDHYNPVDSTWLESTPTGEWISYFPDGLTHTTSYYHDGHRTGKWKRFFFDGRIVETTTYTDYGSLQFRDQYEYRDKKLLPLLKRQFYNNYNYHGPVFVIGDKDSVQFDRVSFHEMTTAGSYVDEKIRIKNLSKREIQITILSNPILDIRSSQLDLRPYDSFDVNLRLRIPVGASKEKIQIKSAEWTFGIEINSFGYHLTISDFESPGRKQLTAKFYFHRTSDEYQMEIVDLSRPKKTKFIPVSKQINRIELNKGQYQLSLVGPFGKKTIEAEVK